MTKTNPTSLARPALSLGTVAGAMLAGASLIEALRLHQPTFLLGLVPAAVILAAIFLLGLRPWPAWSKLTGAVLMLASSAWFTLVGYWFAAGRGPLVGSDYVAAAGGIMAASVFVALLFWGGGWVYRDAQRRGLHAGAWALVTIVVSPYLLGFIAYLIVVVLRDQRALVCPGCGCRLPPNAAYCIRCGRQAQAACPQCQSPVVPGAAFCAHCGATLAGG
ncbi:MAG TPA: zinc ribbon domain-containing protein [Terriglobales bacterium]|nr:zinc ribbon domain-containing protein [Terriglobales bacterium]